MSKTTDVPNSPKKMESPFSVSEEAEEDKETEEEVDPFEEVREHFKPLYESNDLIGFAICDLEGEVLINESFLSYEGVTKAVGTYLASNQQMVDSGRKVNRVTIEMDDIIVVYLPIEQGIGMFILPSDSNVDKAAKLIGELPTD